MNLHDNDDHLPALWMERGNLYHWEDLTPVELVFEDLAERPSRHTSSLGGRSANSSREEGVSAE